MTSQLHDGTKVLSELSGLSRESIACMWEEAKRNSLRLASCSRHNFVNLSPDKRSALRWQCTSCRGNVDDSAALWYGRGLDHA